MLQVKTYLDKSTVPNGGIGLFSAQFIRKNQLIWKFKPEFDISIKISDFDTVRALYPKQIGFIEKYGYIEEENIIIGFDNDRFINHSYKPNIDDSRPYISVANRNIQKGEELFSDYAKLGRNLKGLILPR